MLYFEPTLFWAVVFVVYNFIVFWAYYILSKILFVPKCLKPPKKFQPSNCHRSLNIRGGGTHLPRSHNTIGYLIMYRVYHIWLKYISHILYMTGFEKFNTYNITSIIVCWIWFLFNKAFSFSLTLYSLKFLLYKCFILFKGWDSSWGYCSMGIL